MAWVVAPERCTPRAAANLCNGPRSIWGSGRGLQCYIVSAHRPQAAQLTLLPGLLCLPHDVAVL